MVTFTHLLRSLAPALLALPAAAQAAVTAEADSQAAASQEAASQQAATPEISTSIFGAPLVVNGETVPEADLKRFLALGAGMNQFQVAKFGQIIQFELEMRAEERLAELVAEASAGLGAGEELDEATLAALEQQAREETEAKYAVSPEEADKKFAREIEDFKLRFPTLDVDTEIGRSFLHVDLYRDQLVNAMLFDNLFFPEDPDNWPELTKQLIIGEYGQEWVDDAKQSYERRKAAGEEHGLDYIPPDDPIFVEALKSVVLEGLRSFYYIESDPTELEPGVLLSVEGSQVTIDEVFYQIAPYLKRDQVADAKKWAVMTRLLEDWLEGVELPDGSRALIPQSEFRGSFIDDGSTWDETLNQYDMLALQVHGFPSLIAYATHMRLTESFKRALQAETDAAAAEGEDWSGKVVTDDVLRQSLARTNKITGAAKSNVEVILASAFDFERNEWKENGWAEAEAKAAEVKKMLDEGAAWKDTLEHESDFWDPPIPETGHVPQYGRNFKGTFGGQPQTRNQLLNLLSESEYRIFLDGGAVADHVFFEQARGTIEGPMKGVHGYYITRLMGQTPPVSPLNINEPVHRDIALEHYVRHAMNQKAHELYAAAVEEGRVTGL